MTGPRIDSSAAVLTGEQWSAAQSAPASALLSGDPGKATTNGLGRVLNGDEWSQAQRMTPDQLKGWKIPALPAASRDVTLTPSDVKTKGKKIDTPIIGAIMRQLVDPVLEHPIAGAAMLAAIPAAPVIAGASAAGALAVGAAGAVMGGAMVHSIAQYGWQKAAELSLDPETRKLAEADPERISGEAAAVQAAMLGLAPLIHVGLHAGDVSAGMMEAGARGVKETNLGPQFSEGFDAGHKTADFAALLERGASEPPPTGLRAPKGFEPTAAEPTRARATPVEGLVVPETAKPGRVKSIETEPASASLQEAADVNASVREYQARRVGEDTQDIAAARTADAERLLGLRDEEPSSMAPRRRPGPASYFETPQGAEVLGAMAARHGLPEDANPYHPTASATSPLNDAWKSGHDAATGSYPLYPEGFTMGGALTDNRIPPDFKAPRPPGFEPTIPEGAQLAAALKPSRFRGHSEAEIGDAMQSARLQIEHAQKIIELEDARDAPDIEVITQSERQIEHAQNTLSQGERELAMRGNGTADEPTFKGPTPLYRRLSDDALAAQYRALLEKRTADEQSAIAPIWDADREARAVDQIENRRRPDGSLRAEDKRRLAKLQAEQGEGYGLGRHTFESSSAERRVKEYNRHITAIERELQSRGLDAAEAAQPASGGGLAPVEGTGDVQTRGLSTGVVEKALVNRLDLTVGDLPEYRTVSMADQASRAAHLLSNDPELAARVARGEEPAPRGLLPESVFVAVEQKAILDGDVNTLRELATSKLTSEATTMGQRIRALGERDPESPISAIQEIINTRSGGAKNAPAVARATEAEVGSINEHMAGVGADHDAWSALIDSLTC